MRREGEETEQRVARKRDGGVRASESNMRLESNQKEEMGAGDNGDNEVGSDERPLQEQSWRCGVKSDAGKHARGMTEGCRWKRHWDFP